MRKEKTFDEKMHFYGRLWSGIALIMMLLAPVVTMIVFQTAPNYAGLLAGIAGVCLIYLPSSIVEVVTYAPMLGTGATYLAFITGNLATVKIPCAMNAREICETSFGTKENEIVSTLSVAVSALTTCCVLSLGVLLLVPLTPILQSPVLEPAFSMIVPALFGALGYQYISKMPMIAIAPLVAMVLLCFFIPSMASQVAILVPISAIISIAVAWVLQKKGVIK